MSYNSHFKINNGQIEVVKLNISFEYDDFVKVTIPSLGNMDAVCDDESQIHYAVSSILKTFSYFAETEGSGLLSELKNLGWETADDVNFYYNK